MVQDVCSFVNTQKEKLLAILAINSSMEDPKPASISKLSKGSESNFSALLDDSVFTEEALNSIGVAAESGMNSLIVDARITPVQQKIQRLQSYGSAPSLPKIHIPKPNLSLRKGFKVPAKIDQS